MRTRSAGLVLIAALGWASACRGSDGHGDEPQSTPVGRDLAAFAFPDLAGREVAWSAERGLRAGSGNAQKPDALLIHVFQPDCPACRQQAREIERLRARVSGRTAIVGVAHRLTARDLRAFLDETDVSYPLLLGTGSRWAECWGRGDSMYIVDRRGRISYSQVGFHPSDAERWQAVLEDLAFDRVARYSGPEREGIAVGERLPAIELPLVSGQGSARLGLDEQGELVVEQSGQRRRFRAGIGFFSRYWDFSREEMVHLQDFHERYAKNGLFVFAISMAPDRDAAREWNRELGLTYTVFDGHASQLGEQLAYG